MIKVRQENLPGVAPMDYVYDWVVNRQNPGEMQYNAADQLTTWPGQHGYEYYGDGGLRYQKDAFGSVQKTYNYTPSDLLSSVQHIGLGTTSMTWDAEGNRMGFTSSTGGAYTFIYDPAAAIPAVVEEVTPSVSVFYVREPNGTLVARISGAETLYYHFDDLGSTLFLTGADGTVTDTYTYDTWGHVTNHTGSTEQPYQYVGQLGYYTHYQDGSFPLLQLGVRLYASEIGRFTQRDTMATDYVSDAVYADNNPLGTVDPSGRKCHKVNPNATTNFIGNCLNKLRNCLPCIKTSNVIKRGLDRTDTWEWCDHQNPDANGYTYCGVFKKVCKIQIFNNKSTDCRYVLHELLHASWWYEGKNDEVKVDSASSLAWQYYCDKKAGCYGSTPGGFDLHLIMGMLGCTKLP